MKVLITGGCGFLGSNLAFYFLKKDYEVFIIDSLERKGSINNLEWLKSNSLKNQLTFAKYDISKQEELNIFFEKFAPFELDDIDLCCRAFKKFGLYSAANPIFYKELNGSKKNNSYSQIISQESILKNTQILLARHNDLASR